MRRERPHPGAQLSFTDHDGYRFQAILTDQDDQDIAVLECRHRQHAHVEDRIRDDKDTGLSKFPFKEFALNEVWLEIVMLAHDLIVWTQALALTGELAKAEPKRLRYRLLHVAGRLAFSGRRCEAAPPRHMAVGGRAARRLPEAPSASSARRLTHPTAKDTTEADPQRHRPISAAQKAALTPHSPPVSRHDPQYSQPHHPPSAACHARQPIPATLRRLLHDPG